jgi:hypothetical protein
MVVEWIYGFSCIGNVLLLPLVKSGKRARREAVAVGVMCLCLYAPCHRVPALGTTPGVPEHVGMSVLPISKRGAEARVRAVPNPNPEQEQGVVVV